MMASAAVWLSLISLGSSIWMLDDSPSSVVCLISLQLEIVHLKHVSGFDLDCQQGKHAMVCHNLEVHP